MSTSLRLNLICWEPNRLPQVLTGVALRVEKFTVTKMSTMRWQIELPVLPREQVIELLDTMTFDGIEIHQIDN